MVCMIHSDEENDDHSNEEETGEAVDDCDERIGLDDSEEEKDQYSDDEEDETGEMVENNK